MTERLENQQNIGVARLVVLGQIIGTIAGIAIRTIEELPFIWERRTL